MRKLFVGGKIRAAAQNTRVGLARGDRTAGGKKKTGGDTHCQYYVETGEQQKEKVTRHPGWSVCSLKAEERVQPIVRKGEKEGSACLESDGAVAYTCASGLESSSRKRQGERTGKTRAEKKERFSERGRGGKETGKARERVKKIRTDEGGDLLGDPRGGGERKGHYAPSTRKGEVARRGAGGKVREGEGVLYQ